MMIMEGSKLSKAEYDLKAMMYSAYDTPHELCNICQIFYDQPSLHYGSAEGPQLLVEICYLIRMT